MAAVDFLPQENPPTWTVVEPTTLGAGDKIITNRKKQGLWLLSGPLGHPFVCTIDLHHPPYSTDLTPSDFHLFLALKLAGRPFGSNAEVKQAAKRFFRMQSPEFSWRTF
ncbi:hypothetical protein TNCV_909001 [Trichonephila clavipes]|nr:hypothetical protein TNCV_909001 [Trichonephila clavipes]